MSPTYSIWQKYKSNDIYKDAPATWEEDDDGDEEEDDESQQDAFLTDCDNGNVKDKTSISVRSLPNPRTVIYKPGLDSTQSLISAQFLFTQWYPLCHFVFSFSQAQ